MSKPVLTNPDSPENALRGTRRTLVRAMETILRMIHPFTPYISEEIWQRIAPLAGVSGDTIMLQPYPVSNSEHIDEDAQDEIAWVKDFVIGVRKIRSGMNIDPRKELPVLLQDGSSSDRERLENNMHTLISIGRIQSATWLDEDDEAPESSTALVNEMKLLIPLAGLIDKSAEITRLTKEIERKQNELQRCEGKLSNASFIDKAPDAVVAKEKNKALELGSAVDSLMEQKRKIQAL